MKKFLFRTTSLILVTLMLFFTASCVMFNESGDADESENASKNDNQSDDRYTEAPAEPSWIATIPRHEIYFEGAEISIIYRDHISNSREWHKEILEDELDEAIAVRNTRVQEELGLNVVWKPLAAGDGYTEYSARFFDEIKADVDSGKHAYDISANPVGMSSSLAIRGYSADLNNTEIFPYFNFELPCWNQSIVKNTSIYGELYFVAGIYNFSMLDSTYFMWFNKDLYDQKRESTDPERIAQYAVEGKWTYEALHRWTSAFYVNDGSISYEKDDEDTYAFVANLGDGTPLEAFIYAWDLGFVIKDEDWHHQFNVVDNSKAQTALEKCRELMSAKGTYVSDNVNTFIKGKALFCMDKLYPDYEKNNAIREMEYRRGLLPIPKYDEKQEEYYTTAEGYFNVTFALDHSHSKTPTSGYAISAFLQLTAEEYVNVLGYYFNQTVKPKFFGTDDKEGTVTLSVAVFDMMLPNIVLDYTKVYDEQLGDINRLWIDAFADGEKTLEDLYLADKDSFEAAIKTFDIQLGYRYK